MVIAQKAVVIKFKILSEIKPFPGGGKPGSPDVGKSICQPVQASGMGEDGVFSASQGFFHKRGCQPVEGMNLDAGYFGEQNIGIHMKQRVSLFAGFTDAKSSGIGYGIIDGMGDLVEPGP